MMLDQVKNLSYQMRLFGIHQACERRAAQAFSEQLHPLEFLRLLLEEELLSRKDRTAKALVTKARFRFRADLEDLDLTFHKDLSKAKIKELSELSFLHNLENLLILGKTGLGKTHLAIALGKRLCQEGHVRRTMNEYERYPVMLLRKAVDEDLEKEIKGLLDDKRSCLML
jgi:DNA replication protein DnaC